MSNIGRLFKSVSAEHFMEMVPSGSSVLDCGTGSGDLAISFHGAGYSVAGFDRDYDRMKPLREAGIQTHTGDVLNMPFEDNSFDYVVCRSLLPHVELWKDAVAEMMRVARSGVVFHHNSAEFLPNQRSKGAARFTASLEDLQEFSIDRIVPLGALIISGGRDQIEEALGDAQRFEAALLYERLVLPHLPLACASKFIARIKFDGADDASRTQGSSSVSVPG